jgi:hypothetical protein
MSGGLWYFAVLGLVAGVAYAGSCWLWPFAYCLRCEGKGKFARKDGRVWRNCRRCGGSGRRLRVGRRMWNAARARRRAASK